MAGKMLKRADIRPILREHFVEGIHPIDISALRGLPLSVVEKLCVPYPHKCELKGKWIADERLEFFVSKDYEDVAEAASKSEPKKKAKKKGKPLIEVLCTANDKEDASFKWTNAPVSLAEPIKTHEGSKYLRTIRSCVNGASVEVDVYAVLIAFNVTCPATSHCLKKLLTGGQRGKGDRLADLIGAKAALNRAIQIEEQNGK